MIIAISGGSGSGKTTLAERIAAFCGPAIILNQDHYYYDVSHLSHQEITDHNFDHPKAVDLDLFAQQVKQLKAGVIIDRPVYDFASHSRKGTDQTAPEALIIIEGLFVLHDIRLREISDVKVFVEEADDIRFIRRLLRDINERGCTLQSVVNLYLHFVRPMYQQYVFPSKQFADVHISGSSRLEDNEWKTLLTAIDTKRKEITSTP